MNTKKNVLALLIAGFIFLQAGLVFAQKTESDPSKLSDENSRIENFNESNDVAGSWAATVTPAGGAPFQALLTFDQGGGVIGSAQGDVLLNPPPGVAPGATAVHGSWKRTGNRKYLFTVRQIFYSADGNYEGGNKVRNLVNLNQKGDAFSGQYQFDITDANGNVVFSGSGVIQATRINVEPLNP